jgi:quinol monooxygenase YgiN
MKFIQIIEYSTTKPDEAQAALDEFLAATGGSRANTWARVTTDRDRPNVYLNIVEFPSYDVAMKNSASPETQALAEKMMKIADGPPTFRNLDVTFEEN